ncbi:MAG: AAA family ATPase [Firmicutes bacterium]|nr:AAA family ATPase [Bacillota bacterium]
MYLKKIFVELYRNFYTTEVELEEGLNVIIGANNSGKSNLLKVISFLHSSSKISIDDINKNALMENFDKYKEAPPIIRVKYEIQHAIDFTKPDSAFEKLEKFLQYKEDGGLDEDNNIALLNALIELRYELDPTSLEDYKTQMSSVSNYKEFLEILTSFTDNYQQNFYNVETNSIVETKYVNSIFEVDKIEAERPSVDIENVSKTFVRTQIESVNTRTVTGEINSTLESAFEDITDSINVQIKEDQEEIGITNGKNEFIASFAFDGDFTRYFHYELMNTETGYLLPVSYNGLGYNNLIYISNKIKQKKDNDYNILLIEEPEAHLHPNMQYQLIKYIEKLKANNEKGIQNQIIVTTHSPNISASTIFDHMILFNYEKFGEEMKNVKSIRFGNCFELSKVREFLNIMKLDTESVLDFTRFEHQTEKNFKHYRAHLEKFLDITRSDILFSNKVVLVEGIAEKLTIPIFAELLDIKLTNKHIVIEEVGGINFNNFLPIFIGQNKKAVCFRDCDFKYVISKGKSNELANFDDYESHVNNKYEKFMNREFIGNEYFKFYTQKKFGHTFETELILENYDNDKNFGFLVDMANLPCGIKEFVKRKSITDLNDGIETVTPVQTKEKVNGLLELFYERYNAEAIESKKKLIEKIFFTNLLYEYIKNSKGNFALALASNPNIKRKPTEVVNEKEHEIYLSVPEYIKEGLEWLLI